VDASPVHAEEDGVLCWLLGRDVSIAKHIQIRKKRHSGRFFVSFQGLENSVLVEAAGIEPASVSPQPAVLHA